jgi:hypothetical protein
MSTNFSRFMTACALSLSVPFFTGCIASTPSGDESNGGATSQPECGIGPVPDRGQQDSGIAKVNDAGVVTFDTVAVGTSIDLQVEVKDSADVSETILGGQFVGTGANAFQLMSTFPMDVPAGQSVLLDIRFTPTAIGAYITQLDLQTMKMGISPVAFEGTGGE